jgi:hypothetical protein
MRPYEPLTWDELPDSVKASLPRDAAPAARLAVARSLIPMGTRDLIAALYFLSNDPDRRVRTDARRSLTTTPESMLAAVLGDRISPKILHWFATRDLPDPKLYETIALNRTADDETIAHLAGRVEERLLNIIGNNQERLLRSAAILDALLKNEAAPLSLTERVRSFVEMTTGRSVQDFIASQAKPAEEAAEAPAAEAGPAAPEPAAAPVDAPPPAEAAPAADAAAPAETVTPETGEPAAEAAAAAEELGGATVVDLSGLDTIVDEELPADFDLDKLVKETFATEDNFAADFVTDFEEEMSTQRLSSLVDRIRRMSVMDKMRLGLKGNMEARQILLKSSNKLVQECVLRNTRMTIEEIIKCAKDKTFREELIRYITGNREWTKNYMVVYSLCWNPKTPLVTAMKYLSRLNLKDLQHIAKSKQVPGMLAVQARKMVLEKQRNR